MVTPDCKYYMDGNVRRWSGTPEEQAAYDAWYLREQIINQLAMIDTRSARPLRAVLAAQAAGNTPLPDDIAVLTGLEQEAAALREQLKGVTP